MHSPQFEEDMEHYRRLEIKSKEKIRGNRRQGKELAEFRSIFCLVRLFKVFLLKLL